MEATEYSIVVPVYCSDNALEKLHESLVAFFTGRHSFEIIYVDDNSTDNSWEVLKSIKQKATTATTIVRLSKNFGQHAATVCGFKHAKGKYVITIDDDMEVHPREMEKLIAHQKQTGMDLVYGVYPKQDQSFIRTFFTQSYKFFSKIEGRKKGKGSSFRLIKSALAKNIVGNHQQFIFIDEVCLWYTDKVDFVKVDYNPDSIAKKRYKIGGLLKMTSVIIMFSSRFPLKLVTYIGVILAGTNFIVGSVYLIKKIFFKTHVEGFTSLIVSILFSTGLIILCLGVISLYISQILKSINNSPAFNEDEVIC